MRGFAGGVYRVHDGASGDVEEISDWRDSNLDERFLDPFDVGMDQVYAADRES